MTSGSEKRNDFFMTPVEGETQTVSLRTAVMIACGGGRVHLSKRLAPPLAFCNGRIFCGRDFIFSSDIDLMTSARALEEVARVWGVTLDLLSESGDHVYWSSAYPTRVDFSHHQFNSLWEAYDYMKPHRDRQARQWAIDRGLVRRTPREWFQHRFQILKWKWYNLKYNVRSWIKAKGTPGNTEKQPRRIKT